MSHPTTFQARARLAGLHYRRSDPNDPDIAAAEVDLRTAKAAAYIQRLVDETPPLSADDKLYLTRLLTEPERARS